MTSSLVLELVVRGGPRVSGSRMVGHEMTTALLIHGGSSTASSGPGGRAGRAGGRRRRPAGAEGPPADLMTVTLDDGAASVAADLTSAAAVGPVVVVAHSSGGVVVPRVVDRLGDRVTAVVLSSASSRRKGQRVGLHEGQSPRTDGGRRRGGPGRGPAPGRPVPKILSLAGVRPRAPRRRDVGLRLRAAGRGLVQRLLRHGDLVDGEGAHHLCPRQPRPAPFPRRCRTR